MARERKVDDPELARGSREDIASYVATLSRDLSELARRNNLNTLAYLLDMAHVEADATSRGGPAALGEPGSEQKPRIS